MLELKLDLCLSNYTIKGNGGAYKGCIAAMKYPSDLRDDASFRNEELWESKHVLYSMQRKHMILDANIKKAYLSQIMSNSKHLNYNEQFMMCDVLTKY